MPEITRDWIVAHDSTKGEDAYAIECLRCVTKQRFVLPISVFVWSAAVKAFERMHSKCVGTDKEASYDSTTR
jgi:hypothetical protein